MLRWLHLHEHPDILHEIMHPSSVEASHHSGASQLVSPVSLRLRFADCLVDSLCHLGGQCQDLHGKGSAGALVMNSMKYLVSCKSSEQQSVATLLL